MSSDDSAPPETSEERRDPSSSITLPPDILESIPEDKREEFGRKFSELILELRQEEHYSGPLQPAKEAERWNELVPGSAERSFDLYEQQQLKRMEAQDRILTVFEESAREEMRADRQQHEDGVTLTGSELKNNADEVKRGQVFAFVVVIGIIFGGFTMIHLGHDAGGIASLLVAAASVAGIFVSQLTRGPSMLRRSESFRESVDTDP